MNAVTGLRQIPAAECLRLLRSVPVGRIIFTRSAMPAAEPVKFAVIRGRIIIRVNAGSPLSPALSHTVVAFQADYLDYANNRGWTVTAVGNAREVTDLSEITSVRGTGLETWAAAEDDQFFAITPEIMSGQVLLVSS